MNGFRCLTFVPGVFLALSSMACAPSAGVRSRLIEPDGYVLLDAGSNWGRIVTLRIVDWGDQWVHISVTDRQGRDKTGNMSRSEYQRLLSDLRALRALELKSFERDNVDDADWYRIDIRVGKEHNRLEVYCPWEDERDADTAGMFIAGHTAGSKPHADLVRRLLDQAQRDDLRWDVCTYAFDPDRHLVNTAGAEVEDAFFSDDEELHYATVEPPTWAGGTAAEEDGCVVWHSADRPAEPQRIPFDVTSGGHESGSGPIFPRPNSVADVAFPELPALAFEVGHLAQPRVLCDGRVGVCVTNQHGTRLVAYLLDHPSAYWPVLRLDDLCVHQKQIDLAPDGSRAAWINNGRLFVTENVAIDCERLLEDLESSIKE
jgi:hypothetical protein